MQDLHFRPTIDGLEDRFVPSITPGDVITAYVHTAAVADELDGIRESLKSARTASTISFLATHLRERADSSQADFRILAEYLHDLQTRIASNPAEAGTLNPLAGSIASAEFQAGINAAYAELYAIGFGAPRRVSPPPPPSTDNGVNFGNTGLPFSIADPNFQPIANGVRIWDVTAGTGAALATGTKFTAKYTGYLTNGTIFDSSAKSSNLSGTVGTGLIPGFSAGLVGLKVGGTRRIDIPASQGYGASPPASSGIPPNSELVFEVTLLSSP